MENVLRALQQRHMLALCKDDSSLFSVKIKPLKVGECFKCFKLLETTFHLIKYYRWSKIQKHLECFCQSNGYISNLFSY